MAHVALKAAKRTNEVTARNLRKEGKVPGVLYGFSVANQTIVCDYQAFHKAYFAAGENTVVDLDVDGKTVPVLIHQIDLDPISNDYAHVDFFAINMKQKVTANVPVITEGEAPAVKDLAALLIHGRDTIAITCLPSDLPQNIKVDISILKEFGQMITVGDLKLPSILEIDESPDTVIVSVQKPREEKEPEVAPVAVEGEAAAGEVAKEGAPAGEATGKSEEPAGKKK